MDKEDLKEQDAIMRPALDAVRELGIDVKVLPCRQSPGRVQPDALIRIRHGGQETVLSAVVRRGLDPEVLGAVLQQLDRFGERALLITDYVRPQLADQLRARKVAFIDAAGNANLERPSFVIWVKGQRPVKKILARAAGRVFQPGGLRVIFALLCRREHVGLSYRRIAELVKVAHGTVGETIAELERLRFVAWVGGRRRLLQPERLLQQWVEAYLHTLRPRLILGRFRAEGLEWGRAVNPTRYGLVIGGEGAAERMTTFLRPGTLTFYGSRAEPRFILDYRLKPDPEGTVEILERFWSFDPEDPALAPALLVYADLLSNADARCLEAAKRLYEELLA